MYATLKNASLKRIRDCVQFKFALKFSQISESKDNN